MARSPFESDIGRSKKYINIFNQLFFRVYLYITAKNIKEQL